MARALVWTARQTAEHGGVRPVKLTAQQAREAGSADRYATALADTSALAAVLAAADRPLSEREARGVTLALADLTSREVAQQAGTTPAAERKNAERARADLAARWPDRATLTEDLTAAAEARQQAAEQEAAADATAAATALGWSADLAAHLLASARTEALSDILAAGAARLQSAAPARRLTGGAPSGRAIVEWHPPMARTRAPLALTASTAALPITRQDRPADADTIIAAAVERQIVKRHTPGYGIALFPTSAKRQERSTDHAANAQRAAAAVADEAKRTAAALAESSARRARAWGHAPEDRPGYRSEPVIREGR
jgi:hypothetical protein